MSAAASTAEARGIRVALCQVNPTVGDLDGNAQLILDAVADAAAQGAQLAVLPEQVVCGYPAEDLLLKPHFLRGCADVVSELSLALPIPALIGFPEHTGGVTYNACAAVGAGIGPRTYRKRHLPNYGVFDERRWFVPGDELLVVDVDGARVGVVICEDMWVADGPVPATVAAGADLVVNLSASPYRMGRGRDREQLLAAHARENAVPMLLCNLVGGQDELVFDGASLAVDHTGELVARGPHCECALVVVDVDVAAARSARAGRNGSAPGSARGADVNVVEPAPTPEAEVWSALRLALADYVDKNGFRRVVLGMSGGIDSALVLALAVDALGAERVRCATMPSKVTSSATRDDAHLMARALGVQMFEIAIEPVMDAFLSALAEPFASTEPDIAEENLQARIRGTLLMAISNKHGDLVLTTGNKSETAVGYSTLYGDAAGGFAPIKDVPKTLVYRLATYRNELAVAAGEAPVIPPSIIERPPTAELREGQQDTDSLPPYDELDPLLEALVEDDTSIAQLVADGHDADTAIRVLGLLDRAEYKRRQAPPGIRITSRAFGRERRMPITNRFHDAVTATVD
jgi:NAD+ synthase (glutamine-hydrolysing)